MKHVHYNRRTENRGIVINTYGVVVRDEQVTEAAQELMEVINNHPLEIGEELSLEIRIEATLKTYAIEYDSNIDGEFTVITYRKTQPKPRKWWNIFRSKNDN